MTTTVATRWLMAALFTACAAGFAQAAAQEGRGAAAVKPAVAQEGHGAAAVKPAAAQEGRGAAAVKPAVAQEGGGAAAVKPAVAKEGHGAAAVKPAVTKGANAAETAGAPSMDEVLKRIEAIKAQAAAPRPPGAALATPARPALAGRLLRPAKPAAAGVRLVWPQSLVPNRDLGVRLTW